jgi:Transposase zinc-ribbon domain
MEYERAQVDHRLIELTQQHGDEGCRLYLEELRWPLGVECPRCESADLLWMERRRARWRDSQRENPTAFRDTVVALLAHPWLPFEKLVGPTVAA